MMKKKLLPIVYRKRMNFMKISRTKTFVYCTSFDGKLYVKIVFCIFLCLVILLKKKKSKKNLCLDLPYLVLLEIKLFSRNIA